MDELGLLTVLLSLKALLEDGRTEKALELINEVIKEAKGLSVSKTAAPIHRGGGFAYAENNYQLFCLAAASISFMRFS